jgi:hypothetical protein
VEALLIPDRELEALKTFDSHGGITLSAYLRLDTPEHRESAYEQFLEQVKTHLEECGRDVHCREEIQEDLEIVDIYLKTNGHRWHPGLAIFSCASALFWRVYPLPAPVPTRAAVGLSFDLEPLLQASA